MSQSTHTVAGLKQANRWQILECLRRGPMSRAELSQITGLTKSAVTMLTGEMIRQGLLRETGLAPKSHRAGRTCILLNIEGSYAFAVGLHLHRRWISVTAVDLTGTPIFDFTERTAAFADTKEVLQYIRTSLQEGMRQAALSPDRLVGIGVACPGPLDQVNGIILEPPKFPFFRNFPLVQYLKEEYGCPVFLENNAVALALYEHYYVKPQTGCSLLVTISDGVGSALLQNGEVYRGSHGIAAELGHISVDPAGERCPCGNCGCLELYVPLSSLQKRFGFASYPELMDAAERRERPAEEVVEFLVQKLGAALTTAVNLLDLDRIVLYGEYAYRSDRLMERLTDYLRQHSAVFRAHSVAVVRSGQSESDAPAAAAVAALNAFYRNNTMFSAGDALREQALP